MTQTARNILQIIGGVALAALIVFLFFTYPPGQADAMGSRPDVATQERLDQQAVQRQQSQYAKAQPVPAFDYSLERDLLIQLYTIRNDEVTTHSVWRSDYGLLEGDCPSMGYGIPYDTSLTNPLQPVWERDGTVNGYALSGVGVGQPEPNGVFASTNTSATWVFCVGPAGSLEPTYVEAKVTVYPGPVDIDYDSNRVVRRGDSTVSLTPGRPDGEVAVPPLGDALQ